MQSPSWYLACSCISGEKTDWAKYAILTSYQQFPYDLESQYTSYYAQKGLS